MGNYCNSGETTNKCAADDIYQKSDSGKGNSSIEGGKGEEKNLPAESPPPAPEIPATPEVPEPIINPIVEHTTVPKLAEPTFPAPLDLLVGNPNLCKTKRQPKIVLYTLSSSQSAEKSQLLNILKSMKQKYSGTGLEIIVCDLHQKDHQEKLTAEAWMQYPAEAYGGHEIVANSLAAIARYTNQCYLIPILVFNGALGQLLLPLSIEKQDFESLVARVTERQPDELEVLKKRYKLDEQSQPACYRLVSDVEKGNENELEQVLQLFVNTLPPELRDLYLTTVIEQEINHTVLISHELAKRCIWITNPQKRKTPTATTEDVVAAYLQDEINRRLINIHQELQSQVPETQVIGSECIKSGQLAAALECIVEAVIEDYRNKVEIPFCTFGVDRRLLAELEYNYAFIKSLTQNNRANQKVVEAIRGYLKDNSTNLIIVNGNPGTGKTTLLAEIARKTLDWLPESYSIIRFCKHSRYSSSPFVLLRSIVEQLSILVTNLPYIENSTIEQTLSSIQNLLNQTKRLFVIILDDVESISNLGDHVNLFEKFFLPNVKIIVTGSPTDAAQQKLWGTQCATQEIGCTQEQWKDIVENGSSEICPLACITLPSDVYKVEEKSLIKAKIIWWLAWLGSNEITETSLASIIQNVFDMLESIFTQKDVGFTLSLLLATKEGLRENEMLELLEKQAVQDGQTTLFWGKFCWIMGPLLHHGKLVRIMDAEVTTLARSRYSNLMNEAHTVLLAYFRALETEIQCEKTGTKRLNERKLTELPYQSSKLESDTFDTSEFLTDLGWIQKKITCTGCSGLLYDLFLAKNQQQSHLVLLRELITTNYTALNYDGAMLPVIVSNYMRDNATDFDARLANVPAIKTKWSNFVKQLSSTCLIPLNNVQCNGEDKIVYDMVLNSSVHGYFIVALSKENNEISVWDVKRSTKVRTLQGLTQPQDFCSINDYETAVLCNREIKVVDLDQGKFKVTLKGVMNQIMPYFAIHDAKHLVCLSRNRMYVNMMNLESGDCVTTFKAGEDRFLNSLLVSGDGRILVCGDETSKPFPLLVWSLTQRKLLYDLRIPNHDFVTSMSAITNEGSYVAVVAKELAEPNSPNFIVVYDLQSGTLFKKWKPSYNTVALAISQKNMCVIAGLENAKILMWDLVTGTCRGTLTGHTAPVTQLILDPEGNILLSGDKEGRDVSIKTWELQTGKHLATFIPPRKVTASVVLPKGRYVVLALSGCKDLLMLEMKNFNYSNGSDSNTVSNTFGTDENTGKVFDL